MTSQTISHYRILNRLGAGGMGEVYLAQDTKLDRKVAIKFLPSESVTDEQAKKRLIREAKAAAKLDHPNICSIYEVGEVEGQSFIVMQYVEGETLADRIQRKPLELNESLDIGIQTADALAEAHSRGIVHRDVKPANIMITARGQAKVMDFGLARVNMEKSLTKSEAETESLLTEPGAVIGTVPYMSPEQVRGETLDFRSDIFSFGCVLYEMITGHQPFEGEGMATIISAILTREPLPLIRYLPETPREAQRMVSKALVKDKEKRYQTTKDLLIDIRNLREELAFEAKLERSPQQVGTELAMDEKSRSRASVQTLELPTLSTGEVAGAVTNDQNIISQAASYKVSFAVLAVLLFAAVGAGIFYLLSRHSEHSTIDTVAVLPFINESIDPDAEYLSDGITETLINNLSQLPGLRVMARSTVFRFKGRDLDPQKVGRDLKVQAVLAGRVLQRSDTIVISAELMDVASGTQLWGENYNRKVKDIFAVQDDISKEISSRLRLRLTSREQQALTKRYTDDAEAYQIYLKGRYYWNKRTDESYRKGIEYFQQAIDRDPSYALAYTGLADCYSFMSSQSLLPPPEGMPTAKAAAAKALELDYSLAEAHTSLAYVNMYYDWDWTRAEQEYKRAIELNPRYATPHHGYAYLLISKGRAEEAFSEIEKAEELDPLSLLINTDHGEVFYFARRPAQAIAQLKKSIEMDPTFVRAHFLLGRAYVQNSQCADALAEFQKARALAEESTEMLAALGQGYAWCNKRSEAQSVSERLIELSKHRYVSPHWFAVTYAALGDKDKAFEWLDKAFERRFGPLIYLKVNPIWDNLRSDSRFTSALQRIGLAP